MDAHTHLTYLLIEGAPYEATFLKESTAFRSLRGLHTAQVVLQAGFTTVREIGNDAGYASADIRRALGEGWFEGPTVLSAGKIIAPFGGQSVGIPYEQGPFWQHEYIDADSPDEIRKAVHQNIYYGADVGRAAQKVGHSPLRK